MSTSKLANLFIIPKNEKRKTFDEDNNLPNLPVPDISLALNRYLDSLKPFVTPEEYIRTSELVEAFEKGIGRMLHEKLVSKAQKERNWIEKWWEDEAYLQVRVPLLSCNMIGVMPKNVLPWTYGAEEDQIKHASAFGYHLVHFWKLIRNEELLPTQSADKKINFSMSQYKRLFNTCRLPQDEKDLLVSYFKTSEEGPCPTTVIIICQGRLFSLDTVDDEGKIVPPESWEKSIKEIVNLCNKKISSNNWVGMLTCDTRSNWSKNRRCLRAISQKNLENLSVIDRSMFVIVLDEDLPETDSDVANYSICGNCKNRWADKSISIIFYKNGRIGSLCDHTAFDGIVAITCFHYVVTAVEESIAARWESKKIEYKSEEIQKAPFEELEFDVDETMTVEMNRLEVETSKYKKNVIVTTRSFDDYGKFEIQNLKFHPDSYIQMCLQLAYVRMHGKPAPCYETATTRKFYNGRTETVRSCTTECLEWVASMLNNKFSNDERRRLLEKAVKRHDELVSEARENRGCDRYLLGIYCVALDEGIKIPDLFSDPSYFKSGGGGNFILSTSCTGYTPLGGGVAPMCDDGYGVFYSILPHRLNFASTGTSYLDPQTFHTIFFSASIIKNFFWRSIKQIIGNDNLLESHIRQRNVFRTR